MSIFRSFVIFFSITLLLGGLPARAIELRVSRDALERTLRQQLFSRPDGRYYVKGDPSAGCSIYIEDPRVSFNTGRIAVQVKTHAQLGKSLGGKCLGVTLAPTAVVSVAPVGIGESIGYGDPKVDKISDQSELNFVLTPFLSHQLPAGMQVNAAELLRKALSDSTARSGYKVALDRLSVRSIGIQGDDLIVEVDGDLSVR